MGGAMDARRPGSARMERQSSARSGLDPGLCRNGRAGWAPVLGTWSHFDYGRQKPPEDFVYRYDLDPFSGLERTQQLSGKKSDAMKERLCRAQDALPGLTHGQDSPLCQQIVKPPLRAQARHHSARQ